MATDPTQNATPTTAATDPERHWLEHVHKNEPRQLTVRAVVIGMLIGMGMCLSNLFVVLKTGWSIGVTITAAIVAYGMFASLRGMRLVKKEFTALENNALSSVASGAGYMTGGGNMAALPALLILTGFRPDTFSLVAWFAVIAALGVFATIPIKRQLINIEALPFPTGTATAATIQALHSEGAEGRAQGRYLLWSSVVGGVLAIATGIKFLGTAAGEKVALLRESYAFPFKLRGVPAGDWTISFGTSVLLVGAGMLMSFRTGWSMLFGALLTYGWIVPAMVDAGAIATVSFKAILQWSLWGGAGLLVASGLVSFIFEWRSIGRAFTELTRMFGGKKQAANHDPLAAIECPAWWFPAGFIALSPAVVFLCWFLFGIPWWAGLLSLPLAVVMGLIAARVTGETDVTPTKALGPVTQMVYGAVLPGNMTANIMSANVTGGVGLHAADLLTVLKTGWLLGANPRAQFWGQMFGVVAGAVIVVPAFNLLVPTADLLGTAEWPAPAAQVWAGVSKVLVDGVTALHPTARAAAGVGLLIGAILAIIDRKAPRKVSQFVPSAAGLGIAMIIPFSNSLAFFLGAAIAEFLRRKYPATAKNAVLPVGSGFIAGESLVGVAIALLKAAAIIPK